MTDHKPLVTLFNNPSSKPRARIERWLMDLLRYNFTVTYQPGKSNPADYAPRHPVDVATVDEYDETAETEHYVAYIARNAVPKAMTLKEVELATSQDRVLQAVMACIMSGRWHQPPSNVSLAELSRYENIKNEQNAVPATIQNRTVEIAHEGHLGIVKTKALMRLKVWFPSMDKLVEANVKSCLACQIATPVTSREPLQMSRLPDQPCEEMSVDLAHVDGETLLILIDDYSRFPFIEPVTFEAVCAVIPKIDKIFAMFGTPDVLKSDNGPPFNGQDFAKLANVLGFKHRKVERGEVERFVKTLKKCVKAAKSDGKNWRKEMQAFLRNYRTSPNATTGVAPSTLFSKRAVRNKLPQCASADPVAEIVRKRDTDQKWKMMYHADRKNYHKTCVLSIGESVLVKRPFTASKSHTPYESNPMTIVTRKGSMISAKTDQRRSVTRNSSFFKRLHGRDETEVGADEDPLLDECSEPKPRDDLVANVDSTTKNDNSPVQLTPSPDLPILRRSTRVKAPDVFDL